MIDKEEKNNSQVLQGHHVFLSRSLGFISNMSLKEYQTIYNNEMGVNANDSDRNSINSNDTTYYEL